MIGEDLYPLTVTNVTEGTYTPCTDDCDDEEVIILVTEEQDGELSI